MPHVCSEKHATGAVEPPTPETVGRIQVCLKHTSERLLQRGRQQGMPTTAAPATESAATTITATEATHTTTTAARVQDGDDDDPMDDIPNATSKPTAANLQRLQQHKETAD